MVDAPQSAEGNCVFGICDVRNDGHSVDLTGSESSGGGSGGGGTGQGSSTTDVEEPCDLYDRFGQCMVNVTSVGGDELVTIADIATFRPHPAFDRMQPDGWTIVGLDTNFWGVASTHIVSGTLLGRPAAVRFIPIGYAWNYGDGGTRSSGTGGAPWESLGLGEFEPTATSHIYFAPGTYTITLRVTYRAEYRFDGSGWAQVVGTLTVPANDLVVTVGASAKTVLVDQDCVQNPSGPGC
ncbi:MAG: PKD domain-containing protein [Actinomycetales bacterium]|nr:PKD domain-containing protein [Actinomycetales bacterium]